MCCYMTVLGVQNILGFANSYNQVASDWNCLKKMHVLTFASGFASCFFFFPALPNKKTRVLPALVFSRGAFPLRSGNLPVADGKKLCRRTFFAKVFSRVSMVFVYSFGGFIGFLPAPSKGCFLVVF